MPDASAFAYISKLSIPVTLITTIISGSAYVSTMHSKITHVTNHLRAVDLEFKDFEYETEARQREQGQLIHKIDGKLDQITMQLSAIEARLR